MEVPLGDLAVPAVHLEREKTEGFKLQSSIY